MCVGLMLFGMSARGATGFGDSNTISVDTRPATITTQPASQSVRVGAAVTLSVTAACPTPLSYQWRKNSNDLAGATSATLSLGTVAAADAGFYQVLVIWSWGSLASSAASLVVNTPASITVNPVGQSILAGTSTTLSVAATGTAPLSYQWRKNGINIPGATNTVLVLSNVSAGDAGFYAAVASNAWGSETSAAANLIVLTPPVITSQPAGASIAAGRPVAFSVVASGTSPLGYQWRKDGVAISGATNMTFSIGLATTVDGGSYDVVVSNVYGSVTSASAVLLVSPSAFVYAQSSVGAPGGIVVVPIAVAALGQENGAGFSLNYDPAVMYYQSVQLGSAAAGGYLLLNTGSTNVGRLGIGLALPSGSRFAPGTQDVFRVTFRTAAGYTNESGTAVSFGDLPVARELVDELGGGLDVAWIDGAVHFSPAITSQPISQVVTQRGGGLSFSVGATGTWPLRRQWYKDGLALPGQTNTSLTIPSAGLGEAGSYMVIVTNLYGMAASVAATAEVRFAPLISAQPVALAVMQGGVANFSVAATGSPVLGYQWRKGGTLIAGATGSSLALSGVTTNDAGAYDVVVANAYGSATSVVATLTVTVAPYLTLQPRGTSVLVGTPVSFTVAAGGTQPLVCQWRKDGIVLGGKTGFTLSINNVGASDAGGYSVVISNAYGVVTSDVALLTVNVPPYLTTQPMDLAVLEGSYGGFTVVAGGSTPLTYQWRKNGISLPGGTDDILSLSGVRTNDVGSYDVVVANGYGAITSLVATLTVYVKPFMTVQPVSRSVVAGGTATFTVGAGGTQPLECQWLKDGVALVGKIGLALVLSNVTTNDGGNYSARVSNAFGNVTSAVAALTVNVSPFITGQPVSTSATQGGSAGFSVVAGGTSPLGYQWRKSGAAIGGATTSSLALSGVTTNQAGGYDVVVANAYGAVTSVVATLTVNVPPYIGVQPQGVRALAGQTASLTVGAGGTQPLTCQWRKDGALLAGRTAFSLGLSGVGTNDNGGYDAVIANAYGSATSAVATLVVPWAKLAMTGSTQMAGVAFSMPLRIEAVGNENAVGLSLNYDPARLQFVSASIASNLAGASLLLNTGSTNAGRIGLGISLPSGVALTNGLQELVRVVFLPPVSSSSVVTTLGFGDAPVARQVVDAAAVAQPASFAGAVVTLTPAEYEGDVIPRGRVDGVVRIADWVQVGRFVAALDLATNTGEFQRADCAPRSTQGDGRLTVTDWVQAGRYAVSLDPSVLVGGPRTPTVGPAKRDLQPMGGGRVLRVVSQNVVPGEPVTVQVQLDAQGDENALGFSVGYDASRLTLKKVTLGSGAAGATVNLNTNTVGRVGMAILFQGEGAFGFGQQEVALLEFGTSTGLAGSSALVFGDLPVWRDAANSQAESLATTYENGAITATGGAPALEISNSGSGIRLSWPLGQSSYALEKASGVASGSWSGVSGDRSTNASTITVTVPLENAPSFFRLRKN